MIKLNFITNVIGMAVPAGIALVTIPIYVAHIGLARYGVLSIAWILLGYFGLLDFGLSRATANALARLVHASRQERARVLVTALHLNLSLGAAGGTILYFGGGILLPHMLTTSDALSAEVEAALPWIAGMLPLAMLAGVGQGAIESREDFLAVNVLDLVGMVLGQILPITFAVVVGPSLAIVIPAAFLARAVSVGLTVAFVARSEGVSTLRVFDRARLRELMGFGAWVSVTNIVGPLLTSIDQLLIGSTLGAAAVAHYAVPMSLATRSQVIAGALSRTLFPRFSRLEPKEAKELAVRSVVSLGYSFGAICGPAIILGGPFLTLWMGVDFASRSAPVMELLMIGAWVNGIAFIPFSFLQGQGRPDLAAKLHALEFMPFILILWVLLHRYGLMGGAMAWTARVVTDAALMFNAARIQMVQMLRLLPAIVLVTGAYTITQPFDIAPPWSLLIAACVFVGVAVCAAVFDVTSRQMLFALRGRLIAAVM
jgi:O-antigen/teichoic acid export membrane protein